MPVPLAEHCDRIITAIKDNRVVPFFGAGVNLCGRPEGADGKPLPWQPSSQYLPSGWELSQYLATKFTYPDQDPWDLVRVSQYVATMDGLGVLYRELRLLFNTDYQSTPLHDVFAALPGYARTRGLSDGHLLIVTTNYDDVMERAFADAGEPYDVVAYEAENKTQRGMFWHIRQGSKPRLIEKPKKDLSVSLEERSVVLKIHGAIDRANHSHDNFVITEDHYIDYLMRTDISNLIPCGLAEKMSNSNFLFLGYSMRDWNLRAILHRIWSEQRLSFKSWSVQLDPSPLEQKFWETRGLEIYNVALEEYVHQLKIRL